MKEGKVEKILPIRLPPDMIAEIRGESDRQCRGYSWLMQRAWMIARGTIMKYPDEPMGRSEGRKRR